MKKCDLSVLSREALIAELEAIRAVEREYRTLLDESSDPIFAFRPDGTYRYVNHAFATGVGMAQDAIIGKRIWDVFSQEEADKRYAVVRWVFENGEEKNIEVRVPRPTGDRFYLTTVKPIFDERRQVVSVICISKDITERKLMESRLEHLAQHDALTDLPNRALFSDRLKNAIAQANRDGSRLALLSIDLDRFKPVNDQHGHHVGDLLLQAVARRMLDCVRESDSVARVGGDEFIILLPNIEDSGDAVLVAEKIHRALAQPFRINEDIDLDISSCIGIAVYPDHGGTDLDLLKSADRSMYEAKLGGRDRIQLSQSDAAKPR